MLKLCGFSVSNYYNKVKLALLEKAIPFEEEVVYPSQDEAVKKDSPMGKVPFMRTEHGVLTESQVLVEYLEDAYRERPLYPADAFARAKCR
ncbi:MAG: glutathione S-transferase N-terminal domain-containing protein, partial [Proteobacteria bacterium]|nr:glutathione S-transferase N-terminal domain-containing protein [Pseudomonadota bacterium]